MGLSAHVDCEEEKNIPPLPRFEHCLPNHKVVCILTELFQHRMS